DGGMRDAESALDQLISFCGDKIEEPDVLSMFGLAAQSQILGLSRAVLAGEIQTALGLLNELAKNGKDLGRLLADLLGHFRNPLILEVLTEAELRLRDATSKKILLEVALLKAMEARNGVSLDAVLKQLNQLRGQSGAGGTPATSPASAGARSVAIPSAPQKESGTRKAAALPALETTATPL